MTIEEAFGEVIRELRKANNLSQERLADLSHIDRSFISLLEHGHKQPSLISIFQLAKALVDFLLRLLLWFKRTFDKALLSVFGSIGGLFLLVKGYFVSCCIEKQGLAMRFEEECVSAAALLRNQLTFWSSCPARGHF